MKTFHCTSCDSLVFFENFQCLTCNSALAYLPDRAVMAAIEGETAYRRCPNYEQAGVCNWAIAESDPEHFCESCRLTRVIPDQSLAENTLAWARLETVKRRLLYSLRSLGLPVSGVSFEFLADSGRGDSQRVMTGHDNGVITINIAEADDVYREQQRTRNQEPYRTLMGHMRHEIGHYYWDQLIASGTRLEEFRTIFGDERADYGQSLEAHYNNGPPEQWETAFISSYATMHPWEDWAESWAHYLHMYDALETAAAAGLSLRPEQPGEPQVRLNPRIARKVQKDFDRMIEAWLPLTYILNNLSRGLGLPDSYPFLLPEPVLGKLRFIHETIAAA